MKIVKFAQNNKVKPHQFWIEYEDGSRQKSNEDQICSLWFVWVSAPGSQRYLERYLDGDFLVFEFGKDFIRENDIYALVKRKDEDREKYFREHL